MQGSAYGASLAGGTFDVVNYVKKPQTVLRFLSWIFSIVVFATITAEGYINPTSQEDTQCMYNKNDSACSFGVGIGVLAFMACVVFLIVDAYFYRISNAKERKNTVIGDCVCSAAWTLLWFICFCVLANQWSNTADTTVVPADAARAVIAFSFFSVITWALLTYFAYARYQQGVSDIDQDYRDPASDHTTPYPPAPYSSDPTGYQQSPFTHNQANSGEYQPPAY